MSTLTRRHAENLMAPMLSSPVTSLDSLIRNFFVRPLDLEGFGGMRIDIREDDQAYRVHAELPGFHKENIKIQVEGDLVTISAEHREEQETREGEKLLHSERHYGRVARTFRLGREVDETTAKATFTDGVLQLTLPKKAETASRTSLTIE